VASTNPQAHSLASRRRVAPVRHPWALRTDPPGPPSCPYSPKCVEGVFSEVRTSAKRLSGKFTNLSSTATLSTWHTQKMCQVDIPICPIR
jgi:hypothetical protein